MSAYSADELAELRGALGVDDPNAKGKALEDLVYYMFSHLPGLTLSERNETNEAGSEEIDLGFWKDKRADGHLSIRE